MLKSRTCCLVITLLSLCGIIGYVISLVVSPTSFAQNAVVVISLYLAGIAIAKLITRSDCDNRQLKNLYSIAFAVKLIFVVSMYHILLQEYNTPFIPSDVVRWDLIAKKLAESGDIAGANHYVPSSAAGFIKLNAILYTIFGYNPYILRFIYVLLSALLPIIIYKLMSSTFGRSGAWPTAVFVAFFPHTFVYTGAVPHKEMLVVFFTALIMLQLIKFICEKLTSIVGMIAIFGYWSVLYTIREEVALILGIVAFLWLLVAPIAVSRSLKWLTGLVLIVGVLISTSGEVTSLLSPENLSERISSSLEIRREHAKGGSLIELVTNKPWWIRVPVGSVFLLLRPFPPWEAISGLDHTTLLVPGILMWYVVIPFSIVGIYIALQRKISGSVLMLGYMASILIAANLAQGPAQARYVFMVMPFAFVFAGYGLLYPKQYRRFLPVYGLGFLLGLAFYYILT